MSYGEGKTSTWRWSIKGGSSSRRQRRRSRDIGLARSFQRWVDHPLLWNLHSFSILVGRVESGSGDGILDGHLTNELPPLPLLRSSLARLGDPVFTISLLFLVQTPNSCQNFMMNFLDMSSLLENIILWFLWLVTSPPTPFICTQTLDTLWQYPHLHCWLAFTASDSSVDLSTTALRLERSFSSLLFVSIANIDQHFWWYLTFHNPDWEKMVENGRVNPRFLTTDCWTNSGNNKEKSKVIQ